MEGGDDCTCIKIVGQLEDVKWSLSPRKYCPSRGPLAIGDWTQNQHIWLHYVESDDGLLVDDDVLRSTDSRYWSIHDVQRYCLGDLHCEQVLFTYQYPNLRMPSLLGSYLWRANTALKSPPALYIRELHRSVELTLKDSLQLVSLENLCCKRLEGIQLLETLACFVAQTLKYLFLWRFVLPNENPILINYSYITGSGQYIPRPDSRQCFLRCLGELRNLRVLALEYAYLADGSGYTLLSLLPVIRRPHFRLQLICREDQIPGRADAALGVGGHNIPDTAWRRVAIACPDLYLFMAFYRIQDYDNVRRFLTPSIPLRESHLQLGIDLNISQRQDSDLSCFIRHLGCRYADTLVTLSIQQWRTVEVPMRRILELMPRLTRFMYTGRVSSADVHDALTIVSCGVCEKLKQIKIQIQDEESKRQYWKKEVNKLTEEFADIMALYEIAFSIKLYKA
ncbi:uncharacterized protein LOC123880265 isoform X2 [Maniola jurtina]|uniref:uncharacterized protein LOC123880265 isoform X2 n=1 Tax=Maniola jurtina TaxID=191418 RepID=UPI001E685D36|nr:uncharacterized protein LOC123880265 isoform X2 [Maniola jurtina]